MILVTGAGGTVGSELLKQLRERGTKVRAGFHSRAKAEQLRAQGVDAVALDFADRKSIAAALKGVDKVFLLGATAPNQAELELNVVREAKKAGVKHLVKLSVLDAPGEHHSFARWHREVEKEIEQSGLRYTFLRPNGFMQNFVNYYADTIRSQSVFYLPARDSRQSLVDVRDIAAVASRVLTQKGHESMAYELTGPEALSNTQVAEKLSAALGKPVRYADVTPEAFRDGLRIAGIPEFYADALVELMRFQAAGGVEHVTSDVQKVTGRKPRSFEDFAREYAGSFRARAA